MSVREKILGVESRWLMGRVMAGDFLEGGDDQCRFAVLETDDPLAGYTDKIEQRFAGQREPGPAPHRAVTASGPANFRPDGCEQDRVSERRRA
jgi:hypothetical protein